MVSITELETKAKQKLTHLSGYKSESGIFLMPTEVVEEWYAKSDIPSAFRGKYLRRDAELEIIISDKEHYKKIEVRLVLARGKVIPAHFLEFHDKPGKFQEPKLFSIDKVGRFFNHFDKRTPREEDTEAFISFIDRADNFNILLPIEYHPAFYFQELAEGSKTQILLPHYHNRLVV